MFNLKKDIKYVERELTKLKKDYMVGQKHFLLIIIMVIWIDLKENLTKQFKIFMII